MKRTGNLINKIGELDNLCLAFVKARKGKYLKKEVIDYSVNLDDNLRSLREQILSGIVEVGDYHFFKIYDPKEREICAAPFKERVLHHAIMNICHPIFENQQIFDSYATRKNKGTYAALDRAVYFNKVNGWYLKLDIRKYFDSISHDILFKLILRKIKDKKLLQIFIQIIKSYSKSTNKGLPIGNLTSQYFANYYLSFLDRYIKQELKVKAYVRYMDDMILWENSKSLLNHLSEKITTFLTDELLLDLKINVINRTKFGLPFLGYRIFKTQIKLSKRSKRRFIEKSRLYDHKLKKNEWTETEYQQHILPLLAYVRYANSTGLRTKIFENYKG